MKTNCMDEDYLVRVYNDTVEYCKNRVFRTNTNVPLNKPIDNVPSLVEICHEDILYGARIARQRGYDPVILNMANEWYPGGGVQYGVRAQEEDLFRRTNYHMYIHEDSYPLEGTKCVYTPNVAVIKDEVYNLLDNIEYYPFIAASGVMSPILTKSGALSAEDRELWKEKIRVLFRTAVQYGHDAIILSAWGCGSYHNPPVDVAMCFREVIREGWGLSLFRFSINNIDTVNVFQAVLTE